MELGQTAAGKEHGCAVTFKNLSDLGREKKSDLGREKVVLEERRALKTEPRHFLCILVLGISCTCFVS